MRREYTVQSKLAPVFPYVPQMVAFCDDRAVMDVDFYVMDRINGHHPAEQPAEGDDSSTQTAARALSTSFVERLVDLHAVDPVGGGPGRSRSRPRLRATPDRRMDEALRRRPHLEHAEFQEGRQVAGGEQAADSGSCIIHNDWRLDNVVLDPADPQQIIGVLDWEMATIGDPLMELGSMMSLLGRGRRRSARPDVPSSADAPSGHAQPSRGRRRSTAIAAGCVSTIFASTRSTACFAWPASSSRSTSATTTSRPPTRPSSASGSPPTTCTIARAA